jgi:hypothetical protein
VNGPASIPAAEHRELRDFPSVLPKNSVESVAGEFRAHFFGRSLKQCWPPSGFSSWILTLDKIERIFYNRPLTYSDIGI